MSPNQESKRCQDFAEQPLSQVSLSQIKKSLRGNKDSGKKYRNNLVELQTQREILEHEIGSILVLFLEPKTNLNSILNKEIKISEENLIYTFYS